MADTAGRGREFFTTRTVADALAGFRPGRRTETETVPLAQALRRVPAGPVTTPHPLPGFARSTVDGYAVRAADTYGVSESLPGYLTVVGAVRMGAEPDTAVTPGTVVDMPTGGVIPPGADAVVMVEYTAEAMPGTIEVVRPVAPGEGVVRADEDARPGDEIVPGGRPLRPQDLGMLAAAGVMSVTVHRKPVVTIFSTGDEVVPPEAAELKPGQVRDATASALAALVADAGGEPVIGGIVPDDPGALEKALREALPSTDLLVISAGSSVGARDETANAVAGLGPPGIWCHGLAIKPGKPTLLAECGEVPVIGLPGNPRSALVVFRLIGMPVIRLVGGCTVPPPEPSTRARLSRDLASATGRLDIVQVKVSAGLAVPVFGLSALLSVLTQADGYIVISEEATGLDAGAEVDVILYA
ncbi:MAG TPA: gephyrin-like molybdotransferase Glp [Streptosporangiaceae bacterium]|nr:gephyrin-like molybdotransferase Glp [Streptosporangiaceae bacterium]